MPVVPDTLRRSHRPLNVWLLAFLFGLGGVVGMTRTVLVWQNGTCYQSLGMQVSPVLLAIYGVVWALAGFGGMIVLFFRRVWVRRIVWVCTGVLTLSYWIDRLVLTVNPGRQVNTGFAVVTNLLLLGWVAWVLYRKIGRQYFEVRERQKGGSPGE